MGDAALEGERVDERLQRRTRRARRARHVDRALAFARQIIGGADPGADFAARIVDRDDRRRKLRAETLGALARQFLKLGLQPRVDG